MTFFSDILSSILSCNYSDILSGIQKISGIYSDYLAFYLASILTFYLVYYLASILTFFPASILAFNLTFYLASTWHLF